MLRAPFLCFCIFLQDLTGSIVSTYVIVTARFVRMEGYVLRREILLSVTVRLDGQVSRWLTDHPSVTYLIIMLLQVIHAMKMSTSAIYIRIIVKTRPHASITRVSWFILLDMLQKKKQIKSSQTNYYFLFRVKTLSLLSALHYFYRALSLIQHYQCITVHKTYIQL